MSDSNKEIVVGIHSIAMALMNSSRKFYKLVTTKESLKELKQELDGKNIDIVIKDPHAVQEEGKKECFELGVNYQRIPSNIYLLASATPILRIDTLVEDIISGKTNKIIALDQVTDVHNMGAIFRTAVFYGVNSIIVSRKGDFSLVPTMIRIASGAVEHLNIIQVPNLAKSITKLNSIGVKCIGLSEHETKDYKDIKLYENTPTCLVLGAEDTGISNSVSRVLEDKVALKSQGEIKSLNVSVAASVIMEQFWGQA